MKKLLLLIMIMTSLGMTSCAWATDDQMKETLVKIIEELQAIQPLIDQAAAEQPIHPRVMMHIDNWIDSSGTQHMGLKADVAAIQQALVTAVNRETIEPRVFVPLSHDFVGDDHV